MVAELKILLSVEEDLSDLEELRARIKKIKAVVWKGREKEVDDGTTSVMGNVKVIREVLDGFLEGNNVPFCLQCALQ